MDREKAIRILSKDTSMETVNELNYYSGFNRDKVVEQIQEAMDMGAKALEKQVECEHDCKSCWKTKLVNYENKWIPFTQRKLTTEEKEEMSTDFDYILDCPLPDDDTEILLCTKNGYVYTDTFMNDGDGCYLDGGNDFIDDVVAWQPLPEPYKVDDRKQVE